LPSSKGLRKNQGGLSGGTQGRCQRAVDDALVHHVEIIDSNSMECLVYDQKEETSILAWSVLINLPTIRR